MADESAQYDFVANIKTQDELKKIFINSYNNSRGSAIDTVGIPLVNMTNSICYFISAFNIVSRLQYVIYNEINKLENLTDVFKKIKADECLEKNESKKFNKYLLIQTIIEVHTQEITNKNKFIHERLRQFTFSKDNIDYNAMITDELLKELSNLRLLLAEVSVMTGNSVVIKIIIKLINYINGVFSASKMYETAINYESIYKIGNTYFLEAKNIFLKNYHNWTTDDKELNLSNLKSDCPDFDENELNFSSETYAVSLLKNLLLSHKKFEEVGIIFNKAISKDITMDILCTNTMLNNNVINTEFLRIFFGITINGKSPSGGLMSTFSVQALLDCLDTEDVKIMGDNITFDNVKEKITKQKIPYVIFIFDNLTQLLNNTFTNLKNDEMDAYNLVTLSYSCGHAHSIISTCYGENCLNLKHVLINEHERHELDLKNFSKGFKGKHCKFESMTLENITFELDLCVKKLKDDIKIYSTSNSLTLPNIHGGEDNFKLKYLKYKSKYVALKKIYK